MEETRNGTWRKPYLQRKEFPWSHPGTACSARSVCQNPYGQQLRHLVARLDRSSMPSPLVRLAAEHDQRTTAADVQPACSRTRRYRPDDLRRRHHEDRRLPCALVVGAGITLFVAPALSTMLMIVGALGGFVLALVNTFKKQPSPALILAYAGLEGLFLGGLTRILDGMYPGVGCRLSSVRCPSSASPCCSSRAARSAPPPRPCASS